MNILVVDDIEKNRTILERFLRSQGYGAITAASGADAIDVVNNKEVDLVLMDIKMPDMDGFEATRQIKEQQSVEYLPVIFVTALSEDEALEEALAAGGDDFVTKPISFGTLLSKIKAHSRIRELYSDVNKKRAELFQHNLRLNREQDLVSHFFEQARKNCYENEEVIKSFGIPMTVFNGDTMLSARRPNGGVNILVGDFTGHGLSAAVGTLPVAQVFFQMTEDNAFVGDIARELNKQIKFLLPTEMFLAASIIELSASGDRLMVWHGGMPDAYLFDQKSKEIQSVKSQHLPLGIRDTEDFDDSVQLFYVDENYKFIVMTDGLTEAENPDHVMISSDVYQQAIVNSDGNIIDSVIECYKQYSFGVPQSDDISLLEISCLPVKREASETTNVEFDESIPWNLNLSVEGEMLSRDVVKNVIDLIGNHIALRSSKGVIYTLLAEMYTNALEHGLLGIDGDEKNESEGFEKFYQEKQKRLSQLDSAFIKINISFKPGEGEGSLMIEMSHNGQSFEVNEFNATEDDLHGRGMMLINTICKEVVYSDDGRSLSVVYQF